MSEKEEFYIVETKDWFIFLIGVETPNILLPLFGEFVLANDLEFELLIEKD